jgi:hypothetical protein
MKKLIGIDVAGSYTFNAATRQVTISIGSDITLSNVLLITNVTANTIIYNFASSTLGQTSFSNNVITLDYDTSSMSNNDVLQIYLDLESNEETLHTLLRRMNKLLESNAVVDSSLRQRVVVEAAPTTAVTLATAPTTAVTNTTGFGTAYTINTPTNPYGQVSSNVLAVYEGPVDQRWRIIDSARAAYGTIRSNLIFS